MRAYAKSTTVTALGALCLSTFVPTLAAGADIVSLTRNGIKASRDSRNSDAIAFFSAAIGAGHRTRDSRTAETITVAYFLRADSYEKLYQFDKAIADYSEVIRRNPRSASAYANRGLVYAEVQRFNKAFADYDRALRLDPKNKEVFALRGATFRLQGKWDAALQDAAKAIRLDPKYARAYQVRGRAYEGKKEYGKAIRNFEETIRLSPTYVQAYLARADSIYETGDFKSAAKAYRQLVQLFPQSDRSHYAIAWFLATCPADRLRNGNEAVAEATKACELVQWRDWSNLEALAAAYAEIGAFERATTFLKRAINMKKPEATSADEIELRQVLKSFNAHKPFRDDPRKGSL